MKNILVITPIYPGPGIPETDTQVVHYFAKEWAKEGYRVKTIFLPSIFPSIYYCAARIFKDSISTMAGFKVRTNRPSDMKYTLDSVEVTRIGIKKFIPHTMSSSAALRKIVEKIIADCNESKFVPDYITGHFANPSLKIIAMLKSHFKSTCCYVAHSVNELEVLGNEAERLLNKMDIIGFRSKHTGYLIQKRYSVAVPSFICYSGIPESLLGERKEKQFTHFRNKIVFVGNLIANKNPTALIPAAATAFNGTPFEITFVGDGKESEKIRSIAAKYNCSSSISLTGRLPREKVLDMMDESDIFIMISNHEAFGLVYLEAMSRGLITIASKRNGFDGIIRDGYNGFLCESGDQMELSLILKHIRSLPLEELQRISANAYESASELTDHKAAMMYINAISHIDYILV